MITNIARGGLRARLPLSLRHHDISPGATAATARFVHSRRVLAGFLLAPKSTPAPVISLLAREIRRILNERGLPEKFDVLGFTVVGSTPAQFDALIKKEVQRWPKLIRELGIQGGS